MDLLARIAQIEFFSHVGEPIESLSVKLAGNWDEALRCCNWTVRLGTDRLAACNRFVGDVARHDSERFNLEWNRVAGEIEEALNRTMRDLRLAPSLSDCKDHDRVLKAVRYDLAAACLECEYADIVDRGHFTANLAWYAAGRFPCGWEGYYGHGGWRVVY